MVTMQLATAVLAIAGVGETVLYDFQADWCGPCKTMEPVIGQLAAQGYPVRKVNIDKDRELTQRFNVHSVPCFVAVVNGQERGRLVGATSMDQLVQMVRQAGIHPPAAQIADVRGQSPDRRRRSRSRSGGAAPEVRPPMVSLGQLVETPNPATPAAPAVATAPLPAGAAQAAPARALPPARQAAPPAFASAPPAAMTPPPVPMAKLGSPAGNAIAPAGSAGPTTQQSLADRLMLSAVRLKVQDHDGHSFGSGTFIQFQPAADGRGGNALILTCGHVFRDSKGKGLVTVDLFDGSGVQGIPGRVVRYDLQRDIGLVSVQTPHAVRTAALAPANAKPLRGAEVISIGCDHGRAPTAKRSQITAINSFIGPPNLQVAGQPAVGRSGGGLFNMQAELIGVCNFADPTDRAGLYAAVELARAVINQTGTPLARGLASDNPMPSSTPPLMPTAMPSADPVAKSGERFGALPSGTNASSGSAATEIVCVIKTGSGNDAQRQMFVIENASPELLRKLASEQQRQAGRISDEDGRFTRRTDAFDQPAARDPDDDGLAAEVELETEVQGVETLRKSASREPESP